MKGQKSSVVLFHILSDFDDSSQTESEDETELPNIVDMQRQYRDLREKCSVITFLRHICSKAYKEKVDSETNEQTASKEWQAQRLGRITASVAHTALHAKEETLLNPTSYLVGKIAQRSSFTSKSTEYSLKGPSLLQKSCAKIYRKSTMNLGSMTVGLSLM